MRDHHRRPARRSGGCGHHAAAARHRTPHVPLLIRHAAVRRRRQQPGAAGARADDRRRAGRLRVVDAAATDDGSAVGRDDQRPIARSRGCRCPSTPAFKSCSSARARRWAAKAHLANSSAAFGDFGTTRLALTARDREILLACAAGAGLGAVYSVPLGGALFAAQILLGTWHPRAVGTALITSSLAVAVASPVTHLEHPLDWPDAQTVLPVRVPRAGHRTAGRRHRPGVQPRDGHRPPESAVPLLGSDSRDRGGRTADRYLLDLVPGTAGQRQKHSDGEPRQRDDPRRRVPWSFC